MNLPKKLYWRQTGQGLTEVLIALMVGAILVGAMVVVVITSMKNSEYAQDQTKATKYAQDALDQIRAIRDRNGTVGCSGCTTGTFQDFFSAAPPPLPKYFTISSGALEEQPSSTPVAITGEVGLSREIEVASPPGGYAGVKVTVWVYWNDSKGQHSSQLETVLTPYGYN